MAQSTDRLVPDRSLSVTFQTLRAIEFLAGARRATGTITFSGQPVDADTITIGDGVNTATVFEFDDNSSVTAGNILVTIGGSAEATLDNLLALILSTGDPTLANAQDTFRITGVKSGTTIINLKNDEIGTVGNVTVLESATNVVVTGMTLGADMGQVDTEMTAEVVASGIEIGAVNLQDGSGANPITSTGGALDVNVSGTAAATRVKKTFTAITQAVAAPGTAEAIAAVPTEAVYVLLEARRANGVNTGNVYIGDSTVNRSTNQQQVREPSEFYEFIAPAGVKIDLNELFVDADTATDGVTGFFLPA